MNILVSGGGLAGLTLAYWLHQYGFKPVIIEHVRSIRRSGYGIDFFGTGYAVASRMGLIDWLELQKIPADHISYVDQSGSAMPGKTMQKPNAR